jgi:acyl-CoA oxidase
MQLQRSRQQLRYLDQYPHPPHQHARRTRPTVPHGCIYHIASPIEALILCHATGAPQDATILAVQLAQAVTIAIRYPEVREQGLEPSTGTGIEGSIVDYKHQHFRLITLIAKAYAMFFASRAYETLYTQVCEQQDRGDQSGLHPLHALSAGLKAYVTSEAVDGAEDVRKLRGGHGYMSISGLPDLIGACAGATIFEGEN